MVTVLGAMRAPMNSYSSLELKELSKPGICCSLTAVLNIATCSRAHGGPCPYPDFETELNDYIGQQKEYHFSVVYTRCLDITTNGRMVLVFPLTIYKSLDPSNEHDPAFDRDFEQWPGIPVMLDYDFNGCLDNVAKLQAYKRGFFISEVLTGGMGTVAALEKQMNKIIGGRYPMHYLPPDRVGDFVRAKPDHDCPR
jgi:hypothetical protein